METFIKTITENNCNYRIDMLSKRRDNISRDIDRCLSMDLGEEMLHNKEVEFNSVCDLIEVLCDFRRNHDCATEGDVNYETN